MAVAAGGHWKPLLAAVSADLQLICYILPGSNKDGLEHVRNIIEGQNIKEQYPTENTPTKGKPYYVLLVYYITLTTNNNNNKRQQNI